MVVALVLAVNLFSGIYSKVEEQKAIERYERTIIDKLMAIRDAQKLYENTNGNYAGTWYRLLNFLDSGVLYIIDRKEIVIPLDYGVDSVVVEIDTLGYKTVRDSLFVDNKFMGYTLESLPLVPKSNKPFALWVSELERSSGAFVELIEVRDTVSRTPNREQGHERRVKQPLHFGSKKNVTLSLSLIHI